MGTGGHADLQQRASKHGWREDMQKEQLRGEYKSSYTQCQGTQRRQTRTGPPVLCKRGMGHTVFD